MQGFQTEQYIDILVKIVERDPMTDLSNEVKFFAIQAITTLMDIFPQLVNGLVNSGLVKSMTGVLQNSLGFIDLAEACIKAYEKIIHENPPAVLKSGAVGIILQQIDFFDISTQQRIFRIIMKIARHSSSVEDLDTHILPILPFVSMNLGPDMAMDNQKKVQDSAKIVAEIQESFFNFFGPSDFNKLAEQYEKILNSGIYDIILDQTQRYSEILIKMQSGEDKESSLVQEIDSKPKEQVLTHQTMLTFFKILENAARFSSTVANKFFGQTELLRHLAPFLPPSGAGQAAQHSAEEFPLMLEAISLLQSILSEREQADKEEQKNERPGIREYETQKRQFQLSPDNRLKIAGIAEDLLPRVLVAYEQSINPQFRIKALQVIDKMIALLDDELLKHFIEPKKFANFIFSILKSRHSSSIAVALRITRKVLGCSPMTFAVPFIREGVSHTIREVSTEANFKAFLGIAQSTDIAGKGFDLDIYEVKEALHQVKTCNPDDHVTRDVYERKLIHLVERQKAQEAAAAKSQDQKGEQSAKTNVAVAIVSEAKSLLGDYFDNQQFLEQLGSHSAATKQQLTLLSELTQLSQELCHEATQLHIKESELENLHRIMERICELLTLRDIAITCYEFRQSHLLFALEILLTKPPSIAKVVYERRKAREAKEELKRSEELELQEAEKQGQQLSKKESRCLLLRLRHVVHILLRRRTAGEHPLRALIELSHKVISETDATLVGASRSQAASQGHFLGFRDPLSGFLQPPGQAGDYEHCINALKQLQRRVTVNLIYDPKKQLAGAAKQGGEAPRKLMEPPKGDQLMESDQIIQEPRPELADLEDSHMEDLTPATEKGGDEETLKPQLMKKKGQSHHPALMNLAGSPAKDLASSAIQQQRLNESKVYLKRHYLYSELGEIPVTVEQSSCLQILEDFLRNRIKTIEHVKDLKFDTCGFGGFSGSKAGGCLFGAGSLHGQYQSISQKIMRKNLGNQARKLLDSGNERLTKILNTGVALKIRADKKKKPKKLAEEFGMEGVEFAEKSGSNSHDESHSDYGDEQEEQEIQAEIERQKLLDQFVEDFPNELLDASVPEDQLQQLAKILTRQHAFMVDQLKLGANERMLSGADKMELTEEHEEEMYQLELRLEDFQETMERVQSRLLDKLEERKQRKD